MNREPAPVILLFVKAPREGRVKTRLAASVGPLEALRIYRLLVAAVLTRLPARCRLEVWFDPSDAEREVREWLGSRVPAGATWHAQPKGDLGERLTAAFREALRPGPAEVFAIGGDCPLIPPGAFATAARKLRRGEDAVLGPSADGGYYLIGMRRPLPALFDRIDWGGDRVCRQTLERAAAQGLRVGLLPELRDVDTLEDWHAVRDQLGSSDA